MLDILRALELKPGQQTGVGHRQHVREVIADYMVCEQSLALVLVSFPHM